LAQLPVLEALAVFLQAPLPALAGKRCLAEECEVGGNARAARRPSLALRAGGVSQRRVVLYAPNRGVALEREGGGVGALGTPAEIFLAEDFGGEALAVELPEG